MCSSTRLYHDHAHHIRTVGRIDRVAVEQVLQPGERDELDLCPSVSVELYALPVCPPFRRALRVSGRTFQAC